MKNAALFYYIVTHLCIDVAGLPCSQNHVAAKSAILLLTTMMIVCSDSASK